MKTKDQDKKFKLIPVQKRFQMDCEYVYGSDEVKSYINKIGKRRGKYRVFDDPTFDILK